VYDVVSKLHVELSYEEFEDLIYDMRHMDYKMIGIMEKDELISYAGVAILTTLKEKRHLRVFDFKTSSRYDTKKYDAIMREYLNDYARTAMCKSVVF
jgi:hypothetical protein